jgi:hypothetical protein
MTAVTWPAECRAAALPHRRHDCQPGHPPRRSRSRPARHSPSSSSTTAAATAASDHRATAWLFPGHLPERPIALARLGERLRALGIYAQTGRLAALLDLAASSRRSPGQPPRRARDQCGQVEHEAVGDWSRYAAELARAQSSPTLPSTFER